MIHSIGCTGPTEISSKEVEHIAEYVHDLQASRFVSGCAYGVDTQFAMFAWSFHRDAEHLLLVPTTPNGFPLWHNETLVRLIGGHPNVTVEHVPGGYMKRNDRIVACSDLVVAWPETRQEVLRSGTWSTIRRARKAGVPVDLRPLDEAA